MKIKGCFSHNSDDWKTPEFIYKQVKEKGYFDPCPYKCVDFDGLAIDWKLVNFVNPPYSNLKSWIEKAISEHRKRKQVVLLIPARTDTKAFKMIWDYGAIIEFITGRLKFNEADSAPFPSMLVTLTGKKTICHLINKEDIKLW